MNTLTAPRWTNVTLHFCHISVELQGLGLGYSVDRFYGGV